MDLLIQRKNMAKTFNILDGETVINTIIADEEFMQENFAEGTYAEVEVEPVAKQDTWVITTNAFQKRFPKSSNGISTKYDLMTLFLTDTGYATSLGVASDTLYTLRSMLITGNNRLNSVASVDLQSPDTVSYINMVTNTVFPEAFRLTQEEADSILKTPAADNEIPK